MHQPFKQTNNYSHGKRNHFAPPNFCAILLTIASMDGSPWQRYQSESHGCPGCGVNSVESSSTPDSSLFSVKSSHPSASARAINGHFAPRNTRIGQASFPSSGDAALYVSSMVMSLSMVGTYIFFISGLL